MKRRFFIEIMGVGAGLAILPGTIFANALIEPDNLFEEGDTICFIGDSITHGGKYQTLITNYFLTRFPGQNLHFVNCGISGDTTSGAIRRWNMDIIPNKPTVAVVMLGMNDAHRELYHTGISSTEVLRERKQAFDDYRANMKEIVLRLKIAGCRKILLLTSSPYDQTVKLEKDNNLGVNDTLGDFGKFLMKMDGKENIRVIDFHGPMTTISLLQQKKNPAFSFAPNDRIHPDESGHQLMAYLFLKELEVPKVVSSVFIDYRKKQVKKISNARLSGLECKSHSITFFLEENSLPYPVSEKGSEIMAYVPLEKELNNEIIKFESFPGQNWRLKIDDKNIGDYAAAELHEGINLAFNKNTPQYAQSQNILLLNDNLRKKEVLYRDLVSINIVLEDKQISLQDDTAIQHFFNDYPYGEGKFATQYFIELFSNYFQIRNNLAGLKQEMIELDKQLHVENKPQIHRYELTEIL